MRFRSTSGACRAGATSRRCPPRSLDRSGNVPTFRLQAAHLEHVDDAERRSTAILSGALCRGGPKPPYDPESTALAGLSAGVAWTIISRAWAVSRC